MALARVVGASGVEERVDEASGETVRLAPLRYLMATLLYLLATLRYLWRRYFATASDLLDGLLEAAD